MFHPVMRVEVQAGDQRGDAAGGFWGLPGDLGAGPDQHIGGLDGLADAQHAALLQALKRAVLRGAQHQPGKRQQQAKEQQQARQTRPDPGPPHAATPCRRRTSAWQFTMSTAP